MLDCLSDRGQTKGASELSGCLPGETERDGTEEVEESAVVGDIARRKLFVSACHGLVITETTFFFSPFQFIVFYHTYFTFLSGDSEVVGAPAGRDMASGAHSAVFHHGGVGCENGNRQGHGRNLS